MVNSTYAGVYRILTVERIEVCVLPGWLPVGIVARSEAVTLTGEERTTCFPFLLIGQEVVFAMGSELCIEGYDVLVGDAGMGGIGLIVAVSVIHDKLSDMGPDSEAEEGKARFEVDGNALCPASVSVSLGADKTVISLLTSCALLSTPDLICYLRPLLRLLSPTGFQC
jgi:hypothetical protein